MYLQVGFAHNLIFRYPFLSIDYVDTNCSSLLFFFLNVNFEVCMYTRRYLMQGAQTRARKKMQERPVHTSWRGGVSEWGKRFP